MTPITDMTLPDAVVEKALQVFYDAWLHRLSDKQRMQSAIRAALQAMCDCGMARVGPTYIWSPDGKFFGPRKNNMGTPYDIKTLIIRLDDERHPNIDYTQGADKRFDGTQYEQGHDKRFDNPHRR